MKTYIFVAVTFFATPAFAHSGHTEMVNGHTHTLLDLALISAGPAALLITATVLALTWVKRRND